MRNIYVGILFVAFAAALFLGYASNVAIRTTPVQPEFEPQSFDSSFPVAADSTVAGVAPGAKVTLKLPAVDKEGKGALAEFTVEAKEGSGRLFIGFDTSPIVNADTQSSLRIAFDVARRYSGTAHNYDVFYTFSTQSDAVGGKSAGAAATVATMAALQGSRLRRDTLITGTIEADGGIGPVGRILEKAKAAKAYGFKTFLVPPGEGTQNVVSEECREKRLPNSFVKECSSTVDKVDVASQVPGLKITEVKDVVEAYRMMVVG